MNSEMLAEGMPGSSDATSTDSFSDLLIGERSLNLGGPRHARNKWTMNEIMNSNLTIVFIVLLLLVAQLVKNSMP